MTIEPPSWMKKRAAAPQKSDPNNPYADLAENIGKQSIIPFLNNTLRDDWFMKQFGYPNRSLEEFIAGTWALEEPVYPLEDRSSLANVAQYRQVLLGSASKAKSAYLKFLKDALIGWVMFGKEGQPGDPEAAARVEEQNLSESRGTFADLVIEMGLPRYAAGEEDPLRLLAQLPFPIYITTSHFDFLERELEKENKRYRMEICPWSREAQGIDKKYLPDPTYEPTVEAPLVFHLFGLERFPETLVLSVDDHLNFLVNITQREADAKTSDSAAPPAIPLYLWRKIAGQQLLLLGYRLHSADFQTVFRGIIAGKEGVARPGAGTVIQLKAENQPGVTDAGQLASYLKGYFDQEVKFQLAFGDGVDKYVAELHRYYKSQV